MHKIWNMKLKWLFSLLLVFLGMLGCSEDSIEPVKKDPTRTVLVYMYANNNLRSYAYKNIRSMVEKMTSDNLDKENLIVYLASNTGVSQLFAVESAPELIKKLDEGSENANTLISNYIEQQTEKQYSFTNAAEPAAMQEVIADVKACFPANSYGLVLWSHGSSWIPSDYRSMLRSFGQDGDNWLEVDELAKGLPDHGFEFILFDACYMASIECVYELRNKTNCILASPTETMGDGWPYKLILPYLFMPEVPLQTVGECFYNYYNAQSGYNQTATVSLTHTAMLEPLAAITQEILAEHSEVDIFKLNTSQMQKLEFLSGSPHMLYNFADYIEALATPEQWTRFQQALQAAVVYEAHTETAYFAALGSSYPIARSCGLSVYVPRETLPKINAWYQVRLSWYQAVYR